MRLRRNGQSLIQVLISIGITGILLLVMMSMFSQQNTEVRALKEKLAVTDFQQQLIRSFSDGTLCRHLLVSAGPLTFNSTYATAGAANRPFINLNRDTIPVSAQPGAPPLATAGEPASLVASTLTIATNAFLPPAFQVTNIQGTSSGSTGVYTANFQVNFDQTKLVRALVPASTQITILTSSSGTTQTITGCFGEKPPSIVGTCEAYQNYAGTYLGNVGCWGLAQDLGNDVSCLGGSVKRTLNVMEDKTSPGEKTSNGVDIYSGCLASSPNRFCSVSIIGCVL